MQARMKNPAMIVPDAMQTLMALGTVAKNGDVPARTLLLTHLRASQINGCSVCVDGHARELKKAGETDERLFALINFWNRLNVPTRQVAGEWVKSADARI